MLIAGIGNHCFPLYITLDGVYAWFRVEKHLPAVDGLLLALFWSSYAAGILDRGAARAFGGYLSSPMQHMPRTPSPHHMPLDVVVSENGRRGGVECPHARTPSLPCYAFLCRLC